MGGQLVAGWLLQQRGHGLDLVWGRESGCKSHVLLNKCGCDMDTMYLWGGRDCSLCRGTVFVLGVSIHLSSG